MQTGTRNKLDAILDGMSSDELLEANKMIGAHFKARQAKEVLKLSVGETVQFTARGGRQVSGEIAKINQKTVTVDAGPDGRWKVSPAALTVIEAAA